MHTVCRKFNSLCHALPQTTVQINSSKISSHQKTDVCNKKKNYFKGKKPGDWTTFGRKNTGVGCNKV